MSTQAQPTLQMQLQAIRSEFKKFQLCDWNQNNYDFQGSGVCMGMCLDWLRRIYSPKRVSKSKFGQPGRSAIYNEDEELSGFNPKKHFYGAKSETRFKKQEATQEVYRKARKMNLTNMCEDVIMPELEARKLSAVRRHFGKSDKELPSLSDKDLGTAFSSGELEKVKSWMDDQDTLLFAAVIIEKTPQLIAKGHTAFKTQWALDNFKKTSNYDKIEYDGSRAGPTLIQEDAIDGAWMWKQYILPNLDSSTNGGSAILSSGKVGGSGHDVAFHFLGGKIYFFEPNFGEYSFDDKDHLREMFCRIWDCVYRARGYNWAFWANYLQASNSI